MSLPGDMSEPSVEEILASIKKVIARDTGSGAPSLREQREPLQFSHPAPAVEVDDVLELGTSAEIADEQFGERLASDEPLLTEHARASMRESLAALSVMSEPRAAPQIVRSGETSLEGMARDLLRPALAEWLDKNLPPLVERMVAAEIARIVGKKV